MNFPMIIHCLVTKVSTKFKNALIFQGFFWVRISAPFPMEKGPVFSQKVDEISQSEVHKNFSNFSSLIEEYLGHSKLTISCL